MCWQLCGIREGPIRLKKLCNKLESEENIPSASILSDQPTQSHSTGSVYKCYKWQHPQQPGAWAVLDEMKQ